MPRRQLLVRIYSFFALPLPAKLFLSYLFVVLVGAVPTYLYLKQFLLSEFINDAVQSVAQHAQLLGNFITREPNIGVRLSELEHLAPIMTERITYVSVSGRTLFDSSIEDLHGVENQLVKPEIGRALGKLAPDDAFHLQVPDTGVSRRFSETGQIDTLYVAVKLVDDAGMGSDVLRLAVPIAELERLSSILVRVFRNSQAAAVSAAMVLSLIAAAAFMRPLQRLGRAAQSLAKGDYTVAVPAEGNDEIAAVGRALTHLGQQLRKRLAQAEASEAMLTQLVQGLSVPIAICAPDGRIIAINGAARDTFGSEQARSEQNFLAFVQSERFAAAMSAAKVQAEPEHIAYSMPSLGLRVSGWVHVLTHPAGPPFFAYFGEESVTRPRVFLPRPQQLQALVVADAVSGALQSTQGHLAARHVGVVVEGALSTAHVADAHARVGLALVVALSGIDAEGEARVPLWCIDKRTRVAVVLGAPLTDAAKETVSALLAPLGGSVRVYPERSLVLLCRA